MAAIPLPADFVAPGLAYARPGSTVPVWSIVCRLGDQTLKLSPVWSEAAPVRHDAVFRAAASPVL